MYKNGMLTDRKKWIRNMNTLPNLSCKSAGPNRSALKPDCEQPDWVFSFLG